MTFQKSETYFIKGRETLFSRCGKRFRCSVFVPCKRMTCLRCRSKRRSYFIEQGVAHAEKNEMTLFMTISWMAMNPDNAWQELRDTASQLAKQLSGMKAGPFIKVLSLGEEKRTPHVHYVVPQAMASSIRRIVKKKWKGQVRVHVEPIKEIGRVLGYIFDRNFIPASLDPARIKRMQLLTASRPMKYGFPVNGKKVKRSPAKELKQAFGKAAANHHGKESDMDGVSF